MKSVEAVCATLVEDAKKWRAGADAMEGGARAAGGLAMDERQFGATADNRGVVTAYATLQQKLIKLVSGAVTEFNKIGDTLSLTAQTYLMEDQAGEHAMRRLEDRL
ncbi:hypothetical protein ALI22I_05340 [Saccharothrix sp. ALI-22-I]|uniref:hypothetical protein n=1 Tax=Saccharothrix sp. ALI-22-I TaxID=1933778 RepID=UPI00097C572D|nr:hypothetical protein [Saccharothrix sp. ALI-22-I]ONI92212.1 hypothetical protein ALI22I_05340 [Saccharothrix sp. ALI-22-I]